MFSTSYYAEAVEENENDIEEKMAEYAEKLEMIREKAVSEGKIYDEKLVERVGQHWEDQYESKEEFEYKQNAIKSYVEYNSSDITGWTQFMIKQAIRTHNFDTIIEKKGYGFEIVGLMAELEKIQGNYNHSKQVMKYHEWITQQYSIPNTENEINDRIIQIIDDEKYWTVANEIYKTFNNKAEYGNVPSDLFEKDPEYWNIIAGIGICKFVDTCDVDSLITILETELFRLDVDETSKTTYSFMDSILPKAFAQIGVYHLTWMIVETEDCDYNADCSLNTDTYGTGTNNISLSTPTGWHSQDRWIRVVAGSCAMEHPIPPGIHSEISIRYYAGFKEGSDTAEGVVCTYLALANYDVGQSRSTWIWSAYATSNTFAYP